MVQEDDCQSPARFPPTGHLLGARGRNRGFDIRYDIVDPVVVKGGILTASVGAYVGAAGLGAMHDNDCPHVAGMGHY